MGEVSKSTDGGVTWVNARVATGVSTLAIDPQDQDTVYAATYSSGVLKSTNGGASWSSVNSGLPFNKASDGSSYLYWVRALVVDPQNSNTVYAGTAGGGVFKSTDGGASWSALNSGLTSLSVNALAIDPQNPNKRYVGTLGGGCL